MTLLKKVTLSADAATIDLTSTDLAAEYDSLVVDFVARGTAAAASVELQGVVNGDATAANYRRKHHYASSSAHDVSVGDDQSLGFLPGSTQAAGYFGAGRIVIPNYRSTTHHKVLQSDWSTVTSGVSWNGKTSLMWESTAALTSLTLKPASGNFLAGTTVCVYGVGGVANAGSGATLTVTNWQPLPLNTGWASNSNRWGEAPQYRLVGDVAQVRGAVRNSGTTAFTTASNFATLPVGHRPLVAQFGLMGRNDLGEARIQVTTDGNITLMGMTSDTWFDLGLIEFSISPSGGGGKVIGGAASSQGDGTPDHRAQLVTANAKDDEFNDASGMSGPISGLNAKWTKKNLGTASWVVLDKTLAPGCVLFDIPTGQAVEQGIHQPVPAGDFRVTTLAEHGGTADRQFWGPYIVDSAGNGIGISLDSGPSAEATARIRQITAWVNGTTTAIINSANNNWHLGVPTWASIRKGGNTYYASVWQGHRLAPTLRTEVSLAITFTPAYVGFGRFLGTGQARVALDAFRVS
jgi:hypothetical protein